MAYRELSKEKLLRLRSRFDAKSWNETAEKDRRSMTTPDNLIPLLSASVLIERAKRWAGPITGETVDVFKVYGEDVAGAVVVFARDEVEAERCARAIDAKLRSYPGALIVKYQCSVQVPVRKEQVA